MKLIIENATIAEIEEIASWGVLSGVNVNAPLLARDGNLEGALRKIATLVDGPLCIGASSELATLVADARRLAACHPKLVVNVPATVEGLKAVVALRRAGIRANVARVFSSSQALLAAGVGAFMLTPFLGRLDQLSTGGMELLREIRSVFRQDEAIETLVLAASIRQPRHLIEAAVAGADVAACSPALLKQTLEHPLTELQRVVDDWNRPAPEAIARTLPPARLKPVVNGGAPSRSRDRAAGKRPHPGDSPGGTA